MPQVLFDTGGLNQPLFKETAITMGEFSRSISLSTRYEKSSCSIRNMCIDRLADILVYSR